MGFHVLAYYGSLPDSEGLSTVPPLADGVYATSTQLNGISGFLMSKKLQVIAAYAGCANLVGALFMSPSFLQVAPPIIRPCQAGLLPGNDPAMQVLFDEPIVLSANEVLAAQAGHATGAASTGVVLAFLADSIEAAPAGQSFWIRYTSTGTTTAGQWSRIDIDLDEPLPDGTYSVVGMEHWSIGCIAARLVFPGRENRPGVLGLSGSGGAYSQRSHAVFYEGGLGLFGKFLSYTLPQVEVLSSGSDSSHIGYLRVIQAPGQGQ